MIVFRLREILEQRDISVNKLSKMTGVSRPTLAGMYNNESQMVQLRTLSKVSDALNVDVAQLMTNDDDIRKISFPLTVLDGTLDAVAHFTFQFRDQTENVNAHISLEIASDKYWVVKIEQAPHRKRPDWVYSTIWGISKALCFQIIHTLMHEYMKKISKYLVLQCGNSFYNSLEYAFVIDNCFSGAFSDNFYNCMYHYDDIPDSDRDEPMNWPMFEGSALTLSREQFNDFDRNVIVQFRY